MGKRLEDAGVDRIQFDVMDGNFVPNLTFGPELIAACRKYTNVMFETQLMVSNYNCDTMLDQYTKASEPMASLAWSSRTSRATSTSTARWVSFAKMAAAHRSLSTRTRP